MRPEANTLLWQLSDGAMGKTIELFSVISLVLGGLGNEFLGGTAFVDGTAYVAFTSASDDFESGRGGYVWWYNTTTAEQGIIKLFNGAHGIADIAVSSSGRIYVVGSTTDGANFETSANAAQTQPGAVSDGFVVCVNDDGSDYAATLFGGDETDFLNTVGITSNGFVVAGGYTTSTDLDLSHNALDSDQSGGEGVLVMYNPNLSFAFYTSLVGGPGFDTIMDLHVGDTDIVTAVGSTEGDLPTPNPQLISEATELEGRAAFTARFSVVGDLLVGINSMYYDGEGDQSFNAVDVGDDGAIHTVGVTSGASTLPELDGFRIVAAAYPVAYYVAFAVASNLYSASHGTFMGNDTFLHRKG